MVADSQKESSDNPQFESFTTHGAIVSASKLDVYMRQHRKITYLQGLFESPESRPVAITIPLIWSCIEDRAPEFWRRRGRTKLLVTFC